MSLPDNRSSLSASKLFVATFMILGLLATVNWLQGRFNSSDHRKAVKLVSNYKARSGTALVDALLRKHPGLKKEDISWSSEIRQSCLGHVRVQATIPKSTGERAHSYAFDINLNGSIVHPTDPVTVAILKSLSSSIAHSHAIPN